MQRAEVEELVAKWLRIVAGGDVAALKALLAEDVVDRSGPAPVTGVEPFQTRTRALHAAFEVVASAVDGLVVEGDRIAWRFSLRARHRGAFLGIAPTGREVSIVGVNFQRVDGGRVHEHFTLLDRAGLEQQLRAA